MPHREIQHHHAQERLRKRQRDLKNTRAASTRREGGLVQFLGQRGENVRQMMQFVGAESPQDTSTARVLYSPRLLTSKNVGTSRRKNTW